MHISADETALLRLLQLSSAALPVGAYTFSQGLEYAIESNWVSNADDVKQWLSIQLGESQARVDLPLLRRQISAWQSKDIKAAIYWNAYTLACRETAELRLAETAMGQALLRLLQQQDILIPQQLDGLEASFIMFFALAAVNWQLDSRIACNGYIWSWLENQIANATKIIPLGQFQAQRLLGEMLAEIPLSLDKAESIEDDDIGSALAGLTLASIKHETQRSRLFRS